MIYISLPVIYGTYGEVPALGKPLEGHVFTGGYGKGHGGASPNAILKLLQ
jgi:hypothetical protein